ncbi:hypothetical protein [Corynebacterium sp. 335C]
MKAPHPDPSGQLRRRAGRIGLLMYAFWVLGVCLASAAAVVLRILDGSAGFVMFMFLLVSPFVPIGAVALGLPLLGMTPRSASSLHRVILAMCTSLLGWGLALWAVPDGDLAPPPDHRVERVAVLWLLSEEDAVMATGLVVLVGLVAFAVGWLVMCWFAVDIPGRRAERRRAEAAWKGAGAQPRPDGPGDSAGPFPYTPPGPSA